MAGFPSTIAGLTSGSGTSTPRIRNSSANTDSVLTVSGTAGANDTTFSGIIEDGIGTVALTKAGSSTLTLAGSSANTYTGSTSVQDGTLVLAKTAAIAVPGNLTIGDGTGAPGTAVVQLDGTGGNQIANSSDVAIDSDGRLDLNGQLRGDRWT
jgi:fibronectin-binding autotransporter adhesin